jgi:hypothetical protein
MSERQRAVLASSCARATSAAEMRFRIDRGIEGRKGARVIGLDDGADAIIGRVSRRPWGHARFFTLVGPTDAVAIRDSASVALRDTDGTESSLLKELETADVLMMIATTNSDRAAASVIGAACTVRAITTAGVVIGERSSVSATVSSLRPHARVLMTSKDEQDVVDLLTALRA